MILWIILGILALGVLYWKIKSSHNYWTTKGVKQGKQMFLFGDNIMFAKNKTFYEMMTYMYKKFPNDRYSGSYNFTKPFFVLRDPELIKQITVKDFDHFTDHFIFTPDGYSDVWTKNLFALKGEKWHEMRATLSPAFTSSKMKAMMTLMIECAEQFVDYFVENPQFRTVELKDTFSRFANDVIATCAFGIQCDSLKNKENEFYIMGRKATNFTSLWRNVKLICLMLFPKLSTFVGIKFFTKEIGSFYKTIISETVKYREENKIVRPDMIHLLMEARKGSLTYDQEKSAETETGFATVEESTIGKKSKKLLDISIEDMTAQALIFFFAGFDGISTMMSFMGYELAINPEIQEKLREEIDTTVKAHGKITYEAINKMKYLDMVVSETLRKWTSPQLDRVCVSPYTIEPLTPEEKPVRLDKGDLISIPAMPIHHDEKYYPNPEKFDPERFSDENKVNIKPYTYFPFGLGPRNCIGSRFALLEIKTIFVHLLSKFEICVNKKTQIPIVLVRGFTLNAEKGFWLTFKARDQ